MIIRYFEKNGVIYANPISTVGMSEIDTPIDSNGRVLPKHKNINKLPRQKDGSLYKYYNIDLTPNLQKVMAESIVDKVNEIKQAFTTEVSNGFTCTNGIIMDADINDIIMLKAGYDLVVSLGGTTMSITDYNNVDHLNIPLDDVFTMIQELGVNYETLRTKKNTLRTQADNATTQDDNATTQDELDLVVW